MNTNNLDLNKLGKAYFIAKKYVINSGFSYEIDWQDSICFSSITPKFFLMEYTWVVLASGLSDKVVSLIFPKILSIFKGWDNLTYVQENKDSIRFEALNVFNNPLKIDAIINTSCYVRNKGILYILRKLQTQGIGYLMSFGYIGSTTCFHLAKNLGLAYTKPDRHLLRISKGMGFANPYDFCKLLSDFIEEKIQVVDLVLWRYATLDKFYENRIKRLRLKNPNS